MNEPMPIEVTKTIQKNSGYISKYRVLDTTKLLHNQFEDYILYLRSEEKRKRKELRNK
jgi:hypothetical protein